ncbi:MAG: hypothetical protein ABIK61_04615 [candidate division WOR-3 bacterium]
MKTSPGNGKILSLLISNIPNPKITRKNPKIIKILPKDEKSPIFYFK